MSSNRLAYLCQSVKACPWGSDQVAASSSGSSSLGVACMGSLPRSRPDRIKSNPGSRHVPDLARSGHWASPSVFALQSPMMQPRNNRTKTEIGKKNRFLFGCRNHKTEITKENKIGSYSRLTELHRYCILQEYI
ncbi:hypothetical protein PVAP13_6NG114406 [Panicum virgatum]|uniref:Uncharacterized protein n=1 Tax=Panicum virgatum TaxID=38727 RepID=A0A8T0QZU9_PANVG|nr:hypothetical protein PVAP13_6NG114406 [Panicum virgatum]